ncbi:MAG: hypothetical protein AAGC93_08620 [Cyanobacteria bacterium P01_F01_bin.53]
MPLTEELKSLAARVVWFKTPEEALSDPVYFLCYLMRYGVPEDVSVARRYFTDSDFKQALNNAYPGIFDRPSWAYWNLMLFDTPDRPMPVRNL